MTTDNIVAEGGMCDESETVSKANLRKM